MLETFMLPAFYTDMMIAHPTLSSFYVSGLGFGELTDYSRKPIYSNEHSYMLLYGESGYGEIQLSIGATVQNYKISPQQLFIIPYSCLAAYQSIGYKPWNIYCLFLSGANVHETLNSYAFLSTLNKLSAADGKNLCMTFESCWSLFQSTTNIPTLLHATHSLQSLLSQINFSQQKIKLKKSDAYIEKAVHYMNNHIHEQLSLHALAHHINVSHQHLNYIFQQHLQTTPIQFFLYLKMKYACTLLENKGLTIKQISLSIAIHDSLYFSRLFKKMIGLSPKAYREMLL